MKTALFLLIGLFFVPTVHAQQLSIDTATQDTPKFSRQIIVHTDLEEVIPNHTIICRIMPKKLGLIDPSEVVTVELTSNDQGEATLAVDDNSDVMASCASKELTTQDYCWFFPQETTGFDIFNDESKNEPIYLIAQKSPGTCGKDFSEKELQIGLKSLVPQGTTLPFTHSKFSPSVPTNNIEVPETAQVATKNDITLWQWVVLKLQSIF
jgi:hypothetical protein